MPLRYEPRRKCATAQGPKSMFEGLFLSVAIVLALGSYTAVVRGRSLGWFVPLWFLVSLAATELAPWLLATILSTALAMALFADLSLASMQFALALLLGSALAILKVLLAHFETGRSFERALKTGLGENFEQSIPIERRRHLSHQISAEGWSHPVTFTRPGVRLERDIAYGDAGKRNLLDIYRPIVAGENCPVLLQIHGGAWLFGHKAEQALPLLHHMAGLGWVCVSINYRLSPAATFPDHIVDVKKAIVWVRENIAQWGGDPRFIAVTGGSAGGHLASLAALSQNHKPWQPGFEDKDTSIQAAMPLYGAYDLCDRYNIRHYTGIDNPVLERVMKTTQAQAPELYDSASPITWVSDKAPPFFVIQGTHDTLVWVEEARRFVAELSAASSAEIVYAELNGAQHSFDTVHSPRTAHFMNAAAWWLEWSRANWLEAQSVD